MHLNIYKGLFSLSLNLKAFIVGAIFVSKSRLFQRLTPRYAKDFCDTQSTYVTALLSQASIFTFPF